jgi:hypothetical protein
LRKIVAGLLFGLILGTVDGAAAWFYPEARPMVASIVVGASIKGTFVGLLSGLFARRVQSTAWGVIVGSALGLLFAFLVAVMDARKGTPHYLEIMFPGLVVGAIVGFATQRVDSRSLINRRPP